MIDMHSNFSDLEVYFDEFDVTLTLTDVDYWPFRLSDFNNPEEPEEIYYTITCEGESSSFIEMLEADYAEAIETLALKAVHDEKKRDEDERAEAIYEDRMEQRHSRYA